MSDVVLYSILTISALGVTAAGILYVVAQKFKVYEDPKIDEVEDVLPAANCGGCGYPGCRNFAEAMVNAEDISSFYCPVGGNDTMKKVAQVLGKEVADQDPKVAVVRCSGSFKNRKKTNVYDSAGSCAIATYLYSGDTGCAYGCLGLGDCEKSCDFYAITMDEASGLPIISDSKCVACGACVDACPKDIIDLIPKGKKNRRIYVACMNEEKGGEAKKNCAVACTGCTLCSKECSFDAITIENSLAVIDQEKCKLCGKCSDVCRTGAIMKVNFPERKTKAMATDPAQNPGKIAPPNSSH